MYIAIKVLINVHVLVNELCEQCNLSLLYSSMNDTQWEAHSFMYRNPGYHSSVSEIIINGTKIGHCEAREFPYHMPYATYYCKNYLELGR